MSDQKENDGAAPVILKIDHRSGEKLAKSLAKQLEVELQEDCRNFSIVLPKNLGEGTIRVIDFVDVIGLLAIDAEFYRAVHFQVVAEANTVLRFNYCLEGHVFHRLDDENYLYTLEDHQGSMTANTSKHEQVLSVPALHKTRFISIEVDRSKYRDKLPCDIKDIPEKLSSVLEDRLAKKMFCYQFNYAHIIQQETLELLDPKYKGLVQVTHQEARSLEIIAQQYRQYTDDTNLKRSKTILKEYEMDRLIEARQIIRSEMQDPPTIPELSRRVGINQHKLKRGFKEIFDSTINNYLQKIRIEHAHTLLSTGKYSVKEASLAVGYQNHSFFTRKFVERLKIFPRDVVSKAIQQVTE